MKCMKLGDSIKRIEEKNVNVFLNQGWNYCSKSEWKENVRVTPIKKENENETSKKNLKKNKK